MSEQAFRFSGEAARNYDHYLGPFLFEPSSKIVSELIPEGFEGNLLEVAAGTGRLTRHLVDRLSPEGRLVATDLSEDMLDVARARVSSDKLSFQVADAQALPFPDGSFDRVLCQYGLMFLPDKQKGFDEAYRVLRTGGRFIFATWDDTHKIPFLDLVFNEVLLPFFNSADSAKYVVPFHMHDPEVLEDFMVKAGFRNVVVERKPFMGSAPSPRDLVNGFLLNHSLGKEVMEKDPAALQPLAEKLEHLIGERFGTGPVVGELSAFIGQGVR
jgi:ubiquinone/menaquinone biosynthesis C-methylase UbiE